MPCFADLKLGWKLNLTNLQYIDLDRTNNKANNIRWVTKDNNTYTKQV